MREPKVPRIVTVALLVPLLLLSCAAPETPSPDMSQARALMKEAEDREDQGQFQEAAERYREASEIFWDLASQRFEEEAWPRYCDSLNRMGWILAVHLGAHERARGILEKALKTGETYLPPGHDRINSSLHNLAVIAYYQNRLDEALALNNRLLDLRTQKYGDHHAEVASTLNNLGLVYFAKGELSQALLCYEKSLAVKEKLHGPDHLSSATTQMNLGRIQSFLGNPTDAVRHLETCHRIRTLHMVPDHPQIGASAYVLGMALIETGELDRARTLLELADKIQIETLGEDNPHRAHTLWELAKVRTLEGKGAEALTLLTRAHAIMRSHYGEHDYHVAESLNHLAWSHWKQGHWEKAVTHMDRALEALDYRPGLPGVSATVIDEALIRCLEGRSAIDLSRYHADRQSQHLVTALERIDDALKVIAQKRMGFLTQKSRLSLNRRYGRILTMGVHASLELYRLDDEHGLDRAFAYAEKSKMAVLLDAVHDARAKSFAGIPEDLLERERAFEKQISEYETRLALLIETKDPQAAEIQTALIDTYRDLEAFAQRLQTQYPRYYRLKYQERDSEIPGLRDLAIADGKALVSYHLGQGLLTVFSATGDRVSVRQVSLATGASAERELDLRLPVPDWLVHPEPSPIGLIQDIEKLRTNTVFSRPDAFRFYARKLFRLLLEPVYSELEGKDLVIVPDTRFGTLPFEVLLTHDTTGDPETWDLPYLLKEHSVSYRYSTLLNPESLGESSKAAIPKNGVAFAPVFRKENEIAGSEEARDQARAFRQNLRPLPYSEREVTSVGASFKREGIPFEVFTHRRASEANLAKHSAETDLIHIATHGFFDPQMPQSNCLMLAEPLGGEGDGLLHLNEVYAERMSAGLVVLSACDSGLGTIASGEGILGFCRALFYAGVQSVMVSFWQVSDRSTTELMTHFYQHLLSGQAPATALARAKRHLIEKNTPPYFWAPFVLIGQPRFSAAK